MRITTRAVYQMTEDGFIELERDSYEYDGPIEEAKGGGTSTTVQQADPWEGVQPYLLEGFENLDQYAQDIPSFYPNQTYANFNPLQEQAFAGQLGYAGSPELQNLIGNQFDATNFGLNAVNDPYSNQALQSHIAAAQRPLTQAYQEQVLPGIRDQAEMYGGAGSRTGLAEGVASRGYLDAMGDVSSGMMSQAYGQGLDQQARMMALAPQTMQSGMMPWNIAGQVGSQYQGMDQNAINEAMSRYNFDQTAGYDRYTDYLNTLQGTPWGSSTATGPDPNATNPLTGALGGAAMGAGMYSMMGAGPMALSNPYLAAAMFAGGLLGAF